MVCRFIKYCLSCHPQDHPCQQYAERSLFDIMDLFRVGAYSGEGTYLSVYTYSREIWYEDFKLLAKRNITGLYHKHAWEVELQSNFQACQQNPGMASVIGDLIFSCMWNNVYLSFQRQCHSF